MAAPPLPLLWEPCAPGQDQGAFADPCWLLADPDPFAAQAQLLGSPRLLCIDDSFADAPMSAAAGAADVADSRVQLMLASSGSDAAAGSQVAGSGASTRAPAAAAGHAGRRGSGRTAPAAVATVPSAAKPLRCRSKATSAAQKEAHKRYRERKKQNISDMELEVAAKQQELLALEAENAQLKSRARVLETAQRCSTEIHELMKLLDGLQGLSAADCDMAAGDRSPSQGSLPSSDGSDVSDPAEMAAAAIGGRQQSSAASDARLQQLMGFGGEQAAGEQQEAQMLSLQPKSHWLQLAEQYVSAAGSDAARTSAAAEQQQVLQQQQQAGGQRAPDATEAASTAAGAVGAAAAAGAGCETGSGGGSSSCSSMAESSSSLLTEVGSVDTPEQGLVVYKAFLQTASDMLMAAHAQQAAGDAAAAADTEERVGQLMRSTIARLQPFLVARGQGVVYDWTGRNLETQEVQEPPASLWTDVLAALALDADMQRDALECFALFGAPLTKLLEQRAELVRQYRELQGMDRDGRHTDSGDGGSGDGRAATQPATSSSTSSTSSCCQYMLARAKTLESFADASIGSAFVLQALAANLERYQSLDGVFAHSLTSLLSGAQMAAACVASYPWLPRWHSLMACLQQQKEDEQQQREMEQQQQQPHRRSSRQRAPSRHAMSDLFA